MMEIALDWRYNHPKILNIYNRQTDRQTYCSFQKEKKNTKNPLLRTLGLLPPCIPSDKIPKPPNLSNIKQKKNPSGFHTFHKSKKEQEPRLIIIIIIITPIPSPSLSKTLIPALNPQGQNSSVVTISHDKMSILLAF